MANISESTKSILSRVRNRYYAEGKYKMKSSVDPKNSEPSKDEIPIAVDSASSTVGVKNDATMEKSTSSASAESLSKRNIKKGMKILRKKDDPSVILSKEVDVNIMMTEGGEENPANLFSLNISEEINTFAQIFPPDEAISKSLEKRPCSRSPSHSSGEVPLKKRKMIADSSVENIITVENEENVDSGMAAKDQNVIVHNVDTYQGNPTHAIVQVLEDKAPEEESIIPENNPLTESPIVDPAEANECIEEMHTDDINTSADPAEEDIENIEHSHQLIHNLPPADSISLPDEQLMTMVSHAVPNEEIQTLKAEVLKLREELNMVKGELINVKKILENITAKVPETNKSEHTVIGAICLLKRLIQKGVIPSDVVMDSSIWD